MLLSASGFLGRPSAGINFNGTANSMTTPNSFTTRTGGDTGNSVDVSSSRGWQGTSSGRNTRMKVNDKFENDYGIVWWTLRATVGYTCPPPLYILLEKAAQWIIRERRLRDGNDTCNERRSGIGDSYWPARIASRFNDPKACHLRPQRIAGYFNGAITHQFRLYR